MLSYILYLGGELCHIKKILIQFKDHRIFSVFPKPEVSSFTHARLICLALCCALVVRVSF